MEGVDKDVTAGHVPLAEDEQRKKQCIVLQHSTAEGENDIDVPAIKKQDGCGTFVSAEGIIQKTSFSFKH